MPSRRDVLKGITSLVGVMLTPIIGRPDETAKQPEASELLSTPEAKLGVPVPLKTTEGSQLVTADGDELLLPNNFCERLVPDHQQLYTDPIEALIEANDAAGCVWRMIKDSVQAYQQLHGRSPAAVCIPRYMEKSLSRVFVCTPEELRRDLRLIFQVPVRFDTERFVLI